jgi:amidophosphoribosyltransferase
MGTQCAEHSRLLSRASSSLSTSRRPDSVLDGISVYQARMNLGETLAKRVDLGRAAERDRRGHPHPRNPVDPVPQQLAHLIGKPYREGFVKNRYVGRTFIMPGQEVRKKSVRQKLNVIASEFKGRNVLLVDDSIVRGTTSRGDRPDGA